MHVNWKVPENESPILFIQKTEWSGVRIRHIRVLEGELEEHISPTHELDITLAGELVTERHTASGGFRRSCGKVGSLCLTPAGQPIRASWQDGLENLSIGFKTDFVAQTAMENRFNPNFEFTEIYQKKDFLIQYLALKLLEEAESASPFGKLYADSLTQTLTLHLLKNYTNATSVSENTNGGLSGYKLRRVTEFINENLEHELSLAEIAEVADLSQFHFARAFRRTVGQTPQHYVMHQRIEHAKELLAKEDLPLVEISLRTGFKNQSHFTTLFRKFTKLTPKVWRELKHA